MDGKVELLERLMAKLPLHPSAEERAQCVIMEVLQAFDIEYTEKKRKSNLTAYIERFIHAKRVEGLSGKTLDNYRRYLLQFAATQRKDAGRITADDLRLFLAGKEVKDSSRQTILCTFRSFFGWLTREEIIRKNPTLKIPGIKLNKKRLRKALSQENWERYRDAAATIREKALVEFFYSTGCRISEVVAADIRDIDFERRAVRVIGKGDKERMVYFSYKTRVLLTEYLKTRQDDNPALFINVRGARRMSVRSMQKVLSTMGLRAKLGEKTHAHKIRHTMATHNINKGMNVLILQQLLGHENPSTTQIYAQMSEKRVMHEYEQYAA